MQGKGKGPRKGTEKQKLTFTEKGKGKRPPEGYKGKEEKTDFTEKGGKENVQRVLREEVEDPMGSGEGSLSPTDETATSKPIDAAAIERITKDKPHNNEDEPEEEDGQDAEDGEDEEDGEDDGDEKKEDDGEDHDDHDDDHDDDAVDNDNDGNDEDEMARHAPYLDGIEVQVSCPDCCEGSDRKKRERSASSGCETGGVSGKKVLKNNISKSIRPPKPIDPQKKPKRKSCIGRDPDTHLALTAALLLASRVKSRITFTPAKKFPWLIFSKELPISNRRSTGSKHLTAQMTRQPLNHTHLVEKVRWSCEAYGMRYTKGGACQTNLITTERMTSRTRMMMKMMLTSTRRPSLLTIRRRRKLEKIEARRHR